MIQSSMEKIWWNLEKASRTNKQVYPGCRIQDQSTKINCICIYSNKQPKLKIFTTPFTMHQKLRNTEGWIWQNVCNKLMAKRSWDEFLKNLNKWRNLLCTWVRWLNTFVNSLQVFLIQYTPSQNPIWLFLLKIDKLILKFIEKLDLD